MTTPLVLGEFEERNKRTGTSIKYRVETVTPDLADEVLTHMNRYFLVREPLCADADLIGEPESCSSINTFWKKCCIDSGNSIVALMEEEGKPPKVVGANMTFLHQDGKKMEPLPGNAWINVEGGVLKVESEAEAKILQKYGVSNFLSALGLSVNPKYSGFKIGENLLKCREPLCKHIGIKVTATMFTSPGGQACAARAGFELLFEQRYEEFTFKGKAIWANLAGSSFKMMVKQYDI